jgi:phosphate/sulfate permease
MQERKVPESAWLVVSFMASLTGMAWLALSLDTHWRQVRNEAPLRASVRRKLRLTGAGALLVSFVASLLADHPTMAPLVWIMSLGAAALLVGMLLAWRPRVLATIAPGRGTSV